MSDLAPAATATTTETPAAPAASTPPAAKTFAEAKKEQLARFVATAKGEAPPATDGKPNDGKPATETAEVDADAGALQATTQLSRENRLLKKKLAELESTKPNADKFAQVEQHRTSGKRLEAFRAAGFTNEDFEALVEETIADGKPTDSTDQTTRAVLAKVDALTAKVEAADKEKADASAATKAAEEAKQKEGGIKAVAEAAANTKLADGSARWHFVALVPEAHAEVLEAARAANQKAAKELGRAVTQKEFEDVIFPDAMDLIESQHAERAKRYGATKGPSAAQERTKPTTAAKTPPRTIDGSISRAPSTPTPNNDNKTGKRSFKEAKQRVLEQFSK